MLTSPRLPSSTARSLRPRTATSRGSRVSRPSTRSLQALEDRVDDVRVPGRVEASGGLVFGAGAVRLRIEEQPAQAVVGLGVVGVEHDRLLEQIAGRARVVGGLPLRGARDQFL